MTVYIALLRAVNVGGTGRLPMTELKAMCRDAGFADVQTYIASGNVVFTSKAAAKRVQSDLERRVEAYMGKAIGVALRTDAELRDIVTHNPFPDAPPARVMTFFLGAPPPRAALDETSGRTDETSALGRHEIYVHYPSGIGKSKLKIPAARDATARNMNTLMKLVEMAGRC